MPSDAAILAPPMRQTVRRRQGLLGLTIVVLLAAVALGTWEWVVGSRSVSTDDAYVDADIAQVTPLVSGTVATVLVTDTQPVRAGDILVQMEDSDAKLDVARAEADLALERRKFAEASAVAQALSADYQARAADIAKARADALLAEANLDRSRIDLERRKKLAPGGAVSAEELSSAANGFAAANANLLAARAAVTAMESAAASAAANLDAHLELIRGFTVDTSPSVQIAQAKLDQAKLDLARVVIRAPIDGVVTRRAVQIGEHVAAGSVLMTIVPLNDLYVDANFKEGQLARVHPGQAVTLTADLYGDTVVYHGTVEGFSGGTGAAFALIPAQNATGNWIKVVQRVPVRIKLAAGDLASHPLRVGLSMNVAIDVSDARDGGR